MTDERLDELEAACKATADADGNISLRPDEVLGVVRELRELRRHAAALSEHEGAIGNMHRLLASLCAYGQRPPAAAATTGGRIAIQDPGR